MILFVSGRCDIPAFYSTWFYRRLQAGFVDVRNPFDAHQISRIYLTEHHVDVIVFCTKNPLLMLPRLDEIALPYLFHITLTPYHTEIEPNVMNKKAIVAGIIQLSKKIGKARVIVRYDPIFISDSYSIEYHALAFENLCRQLHPYISKVIISFVDMYKNTQKNMQKMHMITLDDVRMREIGRVLGPIALRYGVYVQTCAEAIDLEDYHIHKGLCNDRDELEAMLGHTLTLKGKSVRKTCACLPTVDIGDYNCCAHFCTYCYANYNEEQIMKRMQMHNPDSSVLLGEITDKDRITVREDDRIRQIRLL